MRILLVYSLAVAGAVAQTSKLLPGTRPFITTDAPVIALVHVRVIDGTGAPPAEDQTIIIDHGRIAAIGSAATTAVPAGAQRMDLPNHTIIPGLVGMHEHLFYPSGEGVAVYSEQGFSFPRVFLFRGGTPTATRRAPG